MERFGISVGGQLLEAVRFAGVGILLGVWYDLFRLFRLLTRPPARRIFVQDLLFFAGAAAITLLLSLPISSGWVRVYHLMALAVGFFCYYQTVGRLIYATARALLRLNERVNLRLRRLFRRGRARMQDRMEAARCRWREKHPKKSVKSVQKKQKNFKNVYVTMM